MIDLRKPLRGLANCHAPNLYSLVYEDRVDQHHGMKRVFYAAPGHTLGDKIVWTARYFPVAPHNHRQDITLTKLFGKILDWEFSECRFGDFWYRYRFHSALLGDMRVENEGQVRFSVETVRDLDRPVFHGATDIHTIELVSPDAAWLVEEGTLFEDMPTVAYAADNWQPTAFGLYIPMGADQLQRVANLIAKEMEVAAIGE